MERSSSSLTPSAGRSSRTAKLPWVRVPVLSKTTVSTLARSSKWLPPFTRMPHLEAPPMPPKKLSGTEMTSAQGQEMTRKISARWNQSSQVVPTRKPGSTGENQRIKDGIRKRARAAMTTLGV